MFGRWVVRFLRRLDQIPLLITYSAADFLFYFTWTCWPGTSTDMGRSQATLTYYIIHDLRDCTRLLWSIPVGKYCRKQDTREFQVSFSADNSDPDNTVSKAWPTLLGSDVSVVRCYAKYHVCKGCCGCAACDAQNNALTILPSNYRLSSRRCINGAMACDRTLGFWPDHTEYDRLGLLT